MAKAQHAQRRNTHLRWWVGGGLAVVLVAGALVGVVVFGSSSGGSNTTTKQLATPAGAAPVSPAQQQAADAKLSAQLAAAVTVTPATGAANVSLDAPVIVNTVLGHLQSVQVTGPTGTPVAGAFTPTGQQWQSAAPLAAGTSYQVSTVVASSSGVTAHSQATFSTLTPASKVTGTVAPLDGVTVGVGQPIVFKFSRSISTPAAQAAVLSHITVTESVPVAGGFRWFSPRELHYRPQAFWPTGEAVTLAADLDGWDAGGGAWGSGQLSVHFTIGDSHVSVANLATHQMTVTDNGQLVSTYPLSAGRTQYPTMDGIHIAMDKSSVVHMVSSTVGIPVNSPNGYDEFVYSDVHISDSGEYVHAAPWSVGSQGVTNVSHGCINLSNANAKQFFNFSQVGDIVEVVDGTRAPVPGDHGVMDWSTDWSQWTPAPPVSATPMTETPSVALPTTTTSTTVAPLPVSPTTPSAGGATTAGTPTTKPATGTASTATPTT